MHRMSLFWLVLLLGGMTQAEDVTFERAIISTKGQGFEEA